MRENSILLYSFERFAFLENNPAFDLAKLLYDDLQTKININLIQLPVNKSCWNKLEIEIKKKYEFIIGFGLNFLGNNRISLEKLALNYYDENLPDDKYDISKVTNIIDSGPIAYKTTFKINELYTYLVNKNIPVELSFNCGQDICNFSYYNCLNYLKYNNITTDIIFIHIPFTAKEIIKYNLNFSSFPIELLNSAIKDYFLDRIVLETWHN